MTFENTSNNGASTDYTNASKFPKIEPLTSTFNPTESSKIGSVSDTANGASDRDKDSGMGSVTAENYNQSLLGQKRPWGLDPFDRNYPEELDFGTDESGKEFDKSLNTVPVDDLKAEKYTAKELAELGTHDKIDESGKGKATENGLAGSEFGEQFNTCS